MADVRIRSRIAYNHFPRIKKQIRANTPKLAYDFAQAVQRQSRMLAPVRTGHLKSSIARSKTGDREHTVRVGAHYGIYVEYGTRHMAAQPYFRPAIEFARKQLRIQKKRVIHR